MYLFFDTETTGLPKNWKAPVTDLNNWPRLVQLAYLLFDSNGNKISEGDFIIKPSGFTIPLEVSRIHRITTERANNEGKDLLTVLRHFNSLIEKSSCLVAHNMSFDENIVGSEFLRNGMLNTIPSKNRICTMESSTNFCAINGPYGYKWPKLSELHYKLFKTDFEEAHNAMVDIHATSRCFWELAKKGVIELNNPIKSTISVNYGKSEPSYLENLARKYKKADEIENLIPYRKGNKWGFCTFNKKIEIDCEFDMAFKFTDGIGRVWNKNDGYGYIDLRGNLITDLKFKLGCKFNEGFAGVGIGYNKWHFIGKYGEIVFNQNEYESIYSFSNGFAGVIQNGKLGFINAFGNLVIPPIYDYHDYDDSIRNALYEEISNGDAAFYRSNISNFQEGCVRLKHNDKYGFVNTNGKIIAPFIFDEADDFSEGIAEVGIISPTNQADIRSGYIDKTGAYVIPLKYQYEHRKVWGFSRQSKFSEGKALVKSMSKRGYGFGQKEFFINKNDESIIESDSYEFCAGFSEGLAVVMEYWYDT